MCPQSFSQRHNYILLAIVRELRESNEICCHYNYSIFLDESHNSSHNAHLVFMQTVYLVDTVRTNTIKLLIQLNKIIY